jgi:hypothetical protein
MGDGIAKCRCDIPSAAGELAWRKSKDREGFIDPGKCDHKKTFCEDGGQHHYLPRGLANAGSALRTDISARDIDKIWLS